MYSWEAKKMRIFCSYNRSWDLTAQLKLYGHFDLRTFTVKTSRVAYTYILNAGKIESNLNKVYLFIAPSGAVKCMSPVTDCWLLSTLNKSDPRLCSTFLLHYFAIEPQVPCFQTFHRYIQCLIRRGYLSTPQGVVSALVDVRIPTHSCVVTHCWGRTCKTNFNLKGQRI